MPPESMRLRGLQPGPPIEGALRTPGSKSLAQRALLCGLFAQGRTHIEGLPGAEDVRATLALLRASGAACGELTGQSLWIEGRPPEGAQPLAPAQAFEVGESATLARLALAGLALGCRPGSAVELRAGGSLERRGSPALIAALRDGGVPFDSSEWPWRVRATAPRAEYTLADPVSSQELSALLIALAAHTGPRRVRLRGPLPSRPYVDMTRGMLEHFGASSAVESEAAATLWTVTGPLRAPTQPLQLEPDASAAAVALAAGCLSGGSVLALGLAPESLQGDVRVAEHLAAFGCRVEWCAEGLRATGWPSRPARLDLAGEPDLAPVLAALGAAAALQSTTPAWTRLDGLGTLPGKESSRIAVLAEGLTRAGWSCEVLPGALRIGPRTNDPDDACTLDPRGDHRMVFAFALLGLLRPNLRVQAPDAVGKSWPSFWSDLEALGARGLPASA